MKLISIAVLLLSGGIQYIFEDWVFTLVFASLGVLGLLISKPSSEPSIQVLAPKSLAPTCNFCGSMLKNSSKCECCGGENA